MTLVLRDIVTALEKLYPPDTAQSWDQVGLVAGDLEQPVERILLALDPTLAVIEEARSLGADLIVTHHPLLMRGIHSVATNTAKGASVTGLVVADIALYVAHTNADVADSGVGVALAKAAGLTETEPLSFAEDQSLGRVGELPAAVRLADFAARLSAALPAAPVGLRVAGDPEAMVRRVAVSGGAGDDLFDAVRHSGADVYVTADLRHHPVLEAREEARGSTPYLIDAGHWGSEAVWLPVLRQALEQALAAENTDGPRVEVLISEICTDPWTFTVGAHNLGGMP